MPLVLGSNEIDTTKAGNKDYEIYLADVKIYPEEIEQEPIYQSRFCKWATNSCGLGVYKYDPDYFKIYETSRGSGEYTLSYTMEDIAIQSALTLTTYGSGDAQDAYIPCRVSFPSGDEFYDISNDLEFSNPSTVKGGYTWSANYYGWYTNFDRSVYYRRHVYKDLTNIFNNQQFTVGRAAEGQTLSGNISKDVDVSNHKYIIGTISYYIDGYGGDYLIYVECGNQSSRIYNASGLHVGPISGQIPVNIDISSLGGEQRIRVLASLKGYSDYSGSYPSIRVTADLALAN